MMKEYQNDVWDIVPKPEGKSIVSSKWICKIKHEADGSIEKYKARFMARGFSQKEGIDYEEDICPSSTIYFDQSDHGTCNDDEVGLTLDGCENILLEWCD